MSRVPVSSDRAPALLAWHGRTDRAQGREPEVLRAEGTLRKRGSADAHEVLSIDPQCTETRATVSSHGEFLGDWCFGEVDFAGPRIHLHPHPEGNRKILGAVAGFDPGEHRDAEVGGLFGYKFGDCAAFWFTSFHRLDCAHYYGDDPAKCAGLPQLD